MIFIRRKVTNGGFSPAAGPVGYIRRLNFADADMADEHHHPESVKPTRRLQLGPFLFIGILFIGLGLAAIGYTAWPAYTFRQEALAMGLDAAGKRSAEADWDMTLSLVLGLVSFVGAVLCLGGAFLIRTHLRDQRGQA
jgi:hypothetical protein